MARIRTLNEIILSLIDYFRTTQPALDTKPGSSARDVIIDGPSTQVAKCYEELGSISNLQSLRQALGTDLDKYAANFGAVRNPGSKSTGYAILAFPAILADFAIDKGGIITAKNGTSFSVVNSLTVSTVFDSYFKSIAAKYRSDLDFVGITDQYAAEVLVEATASGSQGNVSKYSLVSTSIPNITNVTNAQPIGGGKDAENDSTFKNRIFAIFSGSNTGTALGYKTAVKSDSSVIDAVVIEPGDSLMTRDGTEVSVAADGTRTIISEGTGGKVDIYVYGTRVQEVTDSYVYRDKSNTGKPTNSANDFVLGQIADDANKTVTRKRIDDLKNKVLPNQPVNNVLTVSGTLSGGSFQEKIVDDLGRVSGNFEILKDTGAYAGSPWSFDKLHWISDHIYNFSEDKTKQTFNSQDPLTFTDVEQINSIQQNISVTNENSTVSPTDRSSIQLRHSPITSVTRVFNVTTGERYVVISQNPDGSGLVNITGRIKVSGQSLPSVSDILQVDYTWIMSYDPYFDFDNKVNSNNPRTVGDSIDWGLSNAVRREREILVSSGAILSVTVIHPISSVVSVNVYSEEIHNITISSGQLVAIVSTTISNVVSIIRNSDQAQLWNTNAANGTFNGTTIYLPSDSVAVYNDSITIVYNTTDIFNASVPGSFNGNTITIVPSVSAIVGTLVECNYIASISTILPSTLIPALPAIRSFNAFNTNTATNIGCQPATNLYFGSLVLSNLRQGPSTLALTIAGSISPGIITVSGTTISRADSSVFIATSSGLKQNISAAIRAYLGLYSTAVIPSNIKTAKVAKVERVNADSNFDVLEVINTYDLKGYAIRDNSFVKDESVFDASLGVTEFRLPSTANNNSNLPVVGDKLRITFYISKTSDSEDVSFSKSGTLYTQKVFAIIDTIAKSSGFTSGASSSATLTITNMNQPANKARYKAFYDYLAPKTNERITIDYNYDRLITDATLAVEDVRPIGADVLAKAAIGIQVDVTMFIVVTSTFANNSTTVQQNVQDAVTTALTAQNLGTIIDNSDIEFAANSITGVDRVRITHFNKSGTVGSVQSIVTQKNEYIQPGNVQVFIETR
jgi:uncharacterized phage protein gp47/JayE